MIVFAFALILPKSLRLLLRLILYIVEQTPVPREPQFSPSMGHFGTCCVWSSGNKVQSQGSILTRAVGRNLITPHDTGGVFFPFQLLPTSWGTDRWAGMLHCLPICLRVFPSHLSQSQLFGRRG